ncbi:MAG: eL32 family ribosomal protein [archaeon]
MVNEKLLAEKKRMHKKRPHFVRQDYGVRLRVSDNYWRKPRGYHSKMRRGEAGKRKVVQAGYRSPAELRGINLKGFRLVHVETLQQLEKINPKDEMAIMSSNLGLKKRLALVKLAEKKGIKFTNIKDGKKFVADTESRMKARKDARKSVLEKRTSKKEEKKEKKEEKKETKPTTQEKEAKPKMEEKKTEAITHEDSTSHGVKK